MLLIKTSFIFVPTFRLVFTQNAKAVHLGVLGQFADDRECGQLCGEFLFATIAYRGNFMHLNLIWFKVDLIGLTDCSWVANSNCAARKR